MEKKFEYIIDEVELEGYSVKWLDGYGDGGWQVVHVEDYTVKGILYDSGDRKIIGDVKMRRVTFMREVDQGGEKDAVG